jgi:hypothetical protein
MTGLRTTGAFRVGIIRGLVLPEVRGLGVGDFLITAFFVRAGVGATDFF